MQGRIVSLPRLRVYNLELFHSYFTRTIFPLTHELAPKDAAIFALCSSQGCWGRPSGKFPCKHMWVPSIQITKLIGSWGFLSDVQKSISRRPYWLQVFQSPQKKTTKNGEKSSFECQTDKTENKSPVNYLSVGVFFLIFNYQRISLIKDTWVIHIYTRFAVLYRSVRSDRCERYVTVIGRVERVCSGPPLGFYLSVWVTQSLADTYFPVAMFISPFFDDKSFRLSTFFGNYRQLPKKKNVKPLSSVFRLKQIIESNHL